MDTKVKWFWVGRRLQNRVFGKLKGAALSEAFKVVRDNGGLVSGEDDSLEISDKDFEASS
jgi:hypothetical protein